MIWWNTKFKSSAFFFVLKSKIHFIKREFSLVSEMLVIEKRPNDHSFNNLVKLFFFFLYLRNIWKVWKVWTLPRNRWTLPIWCNTIHQLSLASKDRTQDTLKQTETQTDTLNQTDTQTDTKRLKRRIKSWKAHTHKKIEWKNEHIYHTLT